MFTKAIIIDKTKLLKLEIILPLFVFFLPFLFSGPQLITGTMVNGFLFIFALKFPKKSILPIIIPPSIGAFLHGTVFGQLTPFLVYFLPIIWLANAALIKSFQKTKNSIPLPFAIIISSLSKTSLLYIASLLFFNFNAVPKIFITSMGIIQFSTAVFGGIFAIALLKFLKTNYE